MSKGNTMEEEVRLYETTVIVNASLEDPQVEGIITRVQEVLSRGGATVTSIERWGRKRLSYTIKKKNSGYYVNIEFSGPGTLVQALEKFYLLEEQILRFLTIKLDKRALKAKQAQAARQAAAVEEAALAPAPAVIEPVKEEPKAPSATKEPLFEDDEDVKA